VPSVLVGLYQSLIVFAYVLIVSLFMMKMGEAFSDLGNYWGGAIMLLLLVFSVALMGLVIFGYPVYLFIRGKAMKALASLLYTFLFSFVIFVILVLLIVVWI
jgi:hypothetical protein